MKIGLLQCNLISNDLLGNKNKLHKALITAKEQGAELCIASELAICAAPATDLLLRHDFINECHQVLHDLSKTIAQEQLPPLLIGAPIANPVPEGKPLHNCAVLLRGDRIIVICRKTLLNSKGLYADHHYFEPGVTRGVLHHKAWRFAITIGEDSFWQDNSNGRPAGFNQVEDFVSYGADAMINLAGVSFSRESLKKRQQFMAWAATNYRLPVISVNQVGGMDNNIFAGASMLVNANGELCHQAKIFEEDVLVIDLDPQKLQAAPTLEAQHGLSDEELIFEALVIGIHDYIKKCGFSKVVLGLSGGIDSALVATLAVKALGAENVTALLMPSPYSSKSSLEDSIKLAKNLGIATKTIAIEKIMQVYETTFDDAFTDPQKNTTTANENIQARIRANLLMAYSNQYGAMLLNTENKSEILVGYSTLYGDTCGGLSVIGDLYKTEVYQLAAYINEKYKTELIPQVIIDKEPSAELKPNQKDTDSLPPYAILDALLKAYLEEALSVKELISMGFEKETVTKVLNLYTNSQFKRQQMPLALLLSSGLAFSGRLLVASKPINKE